MSGISFGLKNTFKNTKRAVLFLTAILLSVSIVTPLIQSDTASAAAPYTTMSLDDLNKSSSYYITLQTCVSNNMRGTIDASSASYSPTSISWFDDNQAYGYIYPSGKTDCKDIMAKALDIWDVTPEAFLKGMGYSQKDKNAYTWSGTANGDDRKAAFISFVKSAAVTGSSDPGNPGPAAAYLRYDYWWDSNCVVKAFGKVSDITDSVIASRIKDGSTTTAQDGSTSYTQKYISVARVGGVKWGYLYNQSQTFSSGQTISSSTVQYTAYGYHSTQRTITCDDTAKALTQYADDYDKYLDAQAVSAACKAAGFTNSDELAACQNGYNAKLNGNPPTYCNTYANKLQTACVAGYKLTAEQLASGRSDVVAADSSDQGSDSDVVTGSTCGVGSLGWVICPAMSLMSDIFDDIFKGLSDNFLKVDVGLLTGDSGTYTAWSVFRSLANVAFVIAFLVIIFSQLTSQGVSNYGVKKLLPRLIVAAILVNISYFVCQLAVDLSNILGFSLKSVFDNIAATIKSSGTASSDASSNALGVAAITTAIIGAGVISYFALGLLIPVLISGLIAVIMIVLLLVVRKALIVLLIVLSPLAFVAFLLPNTESLFTRWRKLFTSMLMLFPVVSLVFGASSLASQILLGANGDTSTKIAAIAAVSLPLFVVPALLKSSLNAAGNIGARINGMSGKIGGAASKAGAKGFSNSRLGQLQKHRSGIATRRNAQILGGNYQGSNRNPLNWGRNLNSRLSQRINSNAKINRLTGDFGSRLETTGAEVEHAEREQNIKNASSLFTQQGLTSSEIGSLAHGNEITTRTGRLIKPDETTQQAAIREYLKTATVGDAEKLVADSGNMHSDEHRLEIARGIHSNGIVGKAEYMGGDFADRVIKGEIKSDKDIDDAAARRMDSGKFSAESVAGQDADTLKRMVKVKNEAIAGTRSDIKSSSIDDIRKAAQEAQNDPIINKRITNQKAPHITGLIS